MDPPEFPPVPQLDEGLDWTYAMRRDMQCELLMETKVTHIVCIRQAVEAHFIRPNFPELFKYLVLDIADCVTENIIQHFPKVKKFLDDCWQLGGIALVHGNAGISRSAALVISYIMEKYGLSYKAAFLLVQQKRFCINPNDGFAQQLKEYEPIYRAKRTLQNGQTSQQTGKFKRRIEEVDQDGDGLDLTSSEDSCIEKMDCSESAEIGEIT
uniref:Tyrosine-protein phosphatase domain-containing protein n=1 Tax=Strigamia maritima TaxID=126957 RepID=T1JN70_STRMM